MDAKQSAEAVRSAIVEQMKGKSYLRPSGLLESLSKKTGESTITIRQSLARLAREKWIEGVTAHGEPISQVKIIGEIPKQPPNPDLERWNAAMEGANLSSGDKMALLPLYKSMACFAKNDQKHGLAGLLRLRENVEREYGNHRFVVSARYLLSSSKLLDEMPASALKAFGIQVERFPGHPLYVVAGGCANPSAVVLVENPAAFELAISTRATDTCAFIATFGFGLSKGEEEYGKQLAAMVENRFAGAITLVREGSACPPAVELLQHRNIMFWGDLDVAGIEIYLRLKAAIPNLRMSAIYSPMLESVQSAHTSHPYVFSVGKPGQHERHGRVSREDDTAGRMLALCTGRGVDQESVTPDQIEQHAALVLSM